MWTNERPFSGVIEAIIRSVCAMISDKRPKFGIWLHTEFALSCGRSDPFLPAKESRPLSAAKI
jgi:hypothetical protein